MFLFTVTNAAGKKQEFLVEMRKTGSFYLSRTAPGLPAKVKPDVTVSVSDKDMVALSTGKMNVSRDADEAAMRTRLTFSLPLHQPQAAFLRGKLKVKGNLMLGLRWCVSGGRSRAGARRWRAALLLTMCLSRRCRSAPIKSCVQPKHAPERDCKDEQAVDGCRAYLLGFVLPTCYLAPLGVSSVYL